MIEKSEYNLQFRTRTKNLALAVIEAVSLLKYCDALGVIRKQTIRSCTSVAANYRAVCRSRSQKEKFAKLCIVVEEADETVFWLELMIDAGFLKKDDVKDIQKEALEILKVMSDYKHRIKQSIKQSS